MSKEIDKAYQNYLNYIHKIVQGPNEIEGSWFTKTEFTEELLTNDSFYREWGGYCCVEINGKRKVKE